MKPQRVEAAKVFKPSNPKFSGDRQQWVADIRKALYASKIISYTQGYMLMRVAAKQYGWNLNNGGIALMWRGGCIIRSAFLGDIKKAFDKNPNLKAIEALPSSFRTECSRGGHPGVATTPWSGGSAFLTDCERLGQTLSQCQVFLSLNESLETGELGEIVAQ